MEDYSFPFPTASGFLTRFTDFQRENPDRFIVNIATGINGSGDDLYISGYDVVSGYDFDFFISAIGDTFIFLTTDPNAPTPPQDEPPPSADLPFVDIPGLGTVSLAEMLSIANGPQNLLPSGFFYGGGPGFDFGGGGGGFDGRGGGGGSFTENLPDAQWLDEVGFIY